MWKSLFSVSVAPSIIRRILLIFTFWLTLSLGAIPAQAQTGTGTIRVAPTGSDTANCGSVASPCQTLQHAANLIPAGTTGTILVAAGTYTAQSPRQVLQIIGRTITLEGGYTTAFTTADPDTNVTIIDGQNSRRAISIQQAEATLEGFSLINGKAPLDNNTRNSFGGAIDAYISTVTVSNIKVTNNTAQGQASSSGEPGRAGGGGLSFRQSTAFLSQTELSGNTARGGDGSGSAFRGGLGVGGGLFVIDSTILISELTATNNAARAGNAPGRPGVDSGGFQRADGLGGGLALIQSRVSMYGVTANNNTAQGGQAGTRGGLGLGGGIFLELITGAVSVNSATLHNNTARGGVASGTQGGAGLGGGIFATGSALTVTEATILSNLAEGVGGSSQGGDGAGGGIYIDSVPGPSSSLNLTNTILGNNRGIAGTGATKGLALGGGVFLQTGASARTKATFNHVTWANNQVTNGQANAGSALFVNNKADATSNFGIVANHTGAPAAIFSNNDTSVIFNRTLWNNNTNNSQGPIQNNSPVAGSPEFVDSAGNPPDFHLKKNSAAINQAVGSTTVLDVDGQSRPYRPIPNGGAIDLGADEYYSPVFLTVTVVDSATLKLDWTPYVIPQVAGYIIQYQLASGANPPNEGASPITVPGDNTSDTFLLTGLSSGKPYSITIQALDAGAGVVETSNQAVATPADLTPTFLPVIVKNAF